MPHIVTFDGLIARKAGPQRPDDFIKLGDIKGEFQADELTGNFNALNEATNVRPAKGESISIIHPQFREANGLGDSITGEGHPMNVWTNGSASTFEDRMTLDFDSNDVGFGMRQNIDWTAANGGPGSSYLTENFEPLPAMNSFGESLNPVLGIGGTAGPSGTSFMTGKFDDPTNNLTGSAGPGGNDV